MASPLKHFAASLLSALVVAGCGIYEPITPAQRAAIDYARQNKLADEYARTHQRGLGASIQGRPQLAPPTGRSTLAAMPERVDLRPQCPPVYNQGPFRTCTGFSVAKGLGEYLLLQRGIKTPLSANHLYVAAKHAAMHAEKRQGGDGFEFVEWSGFKDTGTSIASALAALEMGGAVPEAERPYPPERLWGQYWDSSVYPGQTFKPNDLLGPYFLSEDVDYSLSRVTYPLVSTALRIKRAKPVNSLAELRASLAQGMPVVCGLVVYESFYSQPVRQTGRVPLPAPTEQVLDGHAMLCVGYDEASGLLLFRNSWGVEWGDRGYCYVPYEAASRGMLRDCWTVEELDDAPAGSLFDRITR